ncbi:MAG: phage tail tape measure C-terminal domain-containing protein [Sulfuriferula sp.]
MSGNLGSLNVELSANTATFQSDLGRAAQIAQTNMEKINRTVETAKRGLEALGIGLSIHAFTEMIKGTLEAADNLGKMSQKVGVSVEALSALKYSATLSDVSLQQLGIGLEKLSKNMLATAQGSGHAISAIEALGITAKGGAAGAFAQLNINVEETKGRLKSSEQVFLDVAEKFSQMRDGSLKTALSMQIFGKAGAELIPLLNQGAEAIKAQREEAERLGVVMSTDMARAAEQFNDNMKILSFRAEGLKNLLANELLRTLDELARSMAAASLEAENSGKGFSFIKTILETLIIVGANVKFTFEAIGEEIYGLGARANALAHGNFAEAKFIHDTVNADIAKSRKDLDAFERRILNPQKHYTVAGLLGEQNKGFEDTTILKKPGANQNQGQSFIDGLKKQIALVGLGEYAALREEARLKKVSVAAEQWIVKLQKTKEAQADLIAQQDAQSASVDNLIARLNKKDFEDPNKVYDYIKAQRDLNDEFDFQTSLIGKTAAAQQILTAARKVDLEVIALISSNLGDKAKADLVAQAEIVKAAAEKSANARLAAERSWETGAKTAMNNYIDAATNAAKQTETLFNSAFKSMEDGLVSLVKNGKLDFKSLADSILSNLIRIQARKAIAGVVGSLGSSSGDFSYVGAILSAIGVGGARASGGPVSGGSSYLVGEKGPEIFTPSGSGKIIPNSALAGGAGGGDVAINIYVSDSGQSSNGKQGNAADMGRRIAGVVKGIIIDEKRPGGLLA